MEQLREEMLEGDEKLFVRFSKGLVKNGFKSDQEGHPVFDTVDMVEIRVPGDKNTIIKTAVKESHKMRFPKVWEQYQRVEGSQVNVEGMPIREWPAITRGQAEELAYLNVYTVEQLAELSDQHGQKIMNYHELKRKAQAFVTTSKDSAAAMKMSDQLAVRDAEIETLKERLAEYSAKFDVLQAQVGASIGEQHGTGGSANRRK